MSLDGLKVKVPSKLWHKWYSNKLHEGVIKAVNNAIKHGCGGNSEKSVSLVLSLTDSAIKFRIENIV